MENKQSEKKYDFETQNNETKSKIDNLETRIGKLEKQIKKENTEILCIGYIKKHWFLAWIVLIILLGIVLCLIIPKIEENYVGGILTFVGILATFIVVGNYAQVKDIENKFNKRTKELDDEFKKQMRDANAGKAIPIIIELNNRISNMIKSTVSFTNVPLHNEDNDGKVAKLQEAANNNIEQFSDYLSAIRFFIDMQVTSYAEEIKNEIERYMSAINRCMNLSSKSDAWREKVNESYDILKDVYDNKIPELRKKMEKRCRKIYGFPTQEFPNTSDSQGTLDA
jgi:hypothetical protein